MIDPMGGPAYLWPFLLGFVLAYLVGSIPFGLLLTRAAGLGDIRQIGSGNIGATNVLRTGNKKLAAATLALDLLKGALPVALAGRFFGPDMAIVGAAGAFLGHCFPVWLRFKGGKGVATAAGVVLGLTPALFPLALAIFAGVVYATRYVSLGSMSAACGAALLAWLSGSYQAAEFYVALTLLIIWLHRTNVRRLLNGTEAKVGDKRDR
ncbi:MAG: glycerol-3-phosphate 1-O-acyltransferase PlsY [Geminicoccaceae bacterium]